MRGGVENERTAAERAAVAADHVVLLDEQHAQTLAGEQRGADEAADARADDDGVVVGLRIAPKRSKRPHGRLRP